MQRIRETLVLALLALLPFHALLVTAGTKLIAGPGHAPLLPLAVWKEAVLAIVLMIALLELKGAVSCPVRTAWLGRQFSAFRFRLDAIDLMIIAFILLGVIVSTDSSKLEARSFILGLKYDFLPPLSFLILRRVEWSQEFQRRLLQSLLIVGAIVAGYGIVTFFLPMDFFTALGYSAGHSLYLPEAPLAAFQQISGTAIRRIQSTMSGPNQLGLWLLIPWSIAIVSFFHRKVFSFIFSLALFLTFSRAAWIGAFIVVMVALYSALPKRRFIQMAGALCAAGCLLLFLIFLASPAILLRATSSRGHFERPLQVFRIIAAHPLGLGLGAAGPAANRAHDTCVFLETGDDPSWAKNSPNLCIFVRDKQVQPLDRACNCPLLPENWYLQIGVELGVIGMLLFITLVMIVVRSLAVRLRSGNQLTFAALLLFIGISAAALFLHAWEDSAVALTTWILLAVSMGLQSQQGYYAADRTLP